MVLTYTPTVSLGFSCPDFHLKGMDEKFYSLQDFKSYQGLLVMFICNHCPYVKAIESRLITLAQDLSSLQISTIGICSNDEDSYPEDSYVNLQKTWREKNYSFPYLYDKTQMIAKAFDAVCTPDFFLFDSKRSLYYRGRLDDSWKDPSQVKNRELFLAAQRMIRGEPPSKDQKPSMGCNIKWLK